MPGLIGCVGIAGRLALASQKKKGSQIAGLILCERSCVEYLSQHKAGRQAHNHLSAEGTIYTKTTVAGAPSHLVSVLHSSDSTDKLLS